MKRIAKLLMIALLVVPCVALFTACGGGLAVGEYEMTGYKIGNGTTISATDVTAASIATKLVDANITGITTGAVADSYAAQILTAINTAKETKVIIKEGNKISFKTGTADATDAKGFEIIKDDYIKIEGITTTEYKKSGSDIAKQHAVKVGDGPQITIQYIYVKKAA